MLVKFVLSHAWSLPVGSIVFVVLLVLLYKKGDDWFNYETYIKIRQWLIIEIILNLSLYFILFPTVAWFLDKNLSKEAILSIKSILGIVIIQLGTITYTVFSIIITFLKYKIKHPED